jgi:hypothetical protein
MTIGDLIQDTEEALTPQTKIGIIVAENKNYYSVKWLFVPKSRPDHQLRHLYGLSITQHFYKTNKPLSIYRVKDVMGNS